MSRCELPFLLINCQNWDSDESLKAYQTYAGEISSLKALFVIQYAPYTGGEGKILWAKNAAGADVPILSARNAIWAERDNDPKEGSPGRVAAMLNDWASKPVQKLEDRFSWVIVHAWSWFRNAPGETGSAEEAGLDAKAGENTARGYRPALWCRQRLTDNVHTVTPTELVRRLTEAHTKMAQ